MAPSTSGKCQLPVREPRTPQRTQAGPEEPATLSPLARRRMIPRKPSLPIFSPKKKAYDPIQEGKMGMQPDVSKAPTLLAVYDVKNVRRGVIGHNGSVIGATRFASRADATRQVRAEIACFRMLADLQMYIMRDGQDAVPLSGRWSDNVAADDLLSAAKNPMSIVADEEKIIVSLAEVPLMSVRLRRRIHRGGRLRIAFIALMVITTDTCIFHASTTRPRSCYSSQLHLELLQPSLLFRLQLPASPLCHRSSRGLPLLPLQDTRGDWSRGY